MQQSHSTPKLITPSQRLREVPVTCTQHSGRFDWHGFRLEDFPDLPESDIRLPGMDHHLLVYHYKALDGEFVHECAGRRTVTHLHSGQLSFIPAGADNRWTFGAGNPSALHVLVHTDVFEKAAPGASTSMRDDFQVTAPALRNIARRLQIELTQNGASGVMFAETVIQMLCGAMANQFGEQRPDGLSEIGNVANARELINDEYDRKIRLAELAALCDLSQSQLLRAFKKQFGTSPHQYLLDRRIEMAKRCLLSETCEPLGQLAASLGFADQSHFTRQFCRATGVTPNRFRSSH